MNEQIPESTTAFTLHDLWKRTFVYRRGDGGWYRVLLSAAFETPHEPISDEAAARAYEAYKGRYNRKTRG